MNSKYLLKVDQAKIVDGLDVGCESSKFWVGLTGGWMVAM